MNIVYFISYAVPKILQYRLDKCPSFEMIQMNLQNRNRLTELRERIYGCQGEEGGEWIVREFGMDMYMPLYWKCITNKDRLYSTGNSAQSLEGREVLGENGCMYMYSWVALLCTWDYHNVVITYTPIQN